MRVHQTSGFRRWLEKLRDQRAHDRIVERLLAIQTTGQIVGDVKAVGGGVSELRFNVGPGYRVYFTIKGREMLVLLVGGDKGSQERDIAKAQELAQEWRQNDA